MGQKGLVADSGDLVGFLALLIPPQTPPIPADHCGQHRQQDEDRHRQADKSIPHQVGPRIPDILSHLQQQSGPLLLGDLCEKLAQFRLEGFRRQVREQQLVNYALPVLQRLHHRNAVRVRMWETLSGRTAGYQIHLPVLRQVAPPVADTGLEIPHLVPALLGKPGQQFRDHALVGLCAGVVVFQRVQIRISRYKNDDIFHGMVSLIPQFLSFSERVTGSVPAPAPVPPRPLPAPPLSGYAPPSPAAA